MGSGLGSVQSGCLRVIREYQAAGRSPTTYNIVAEVYRVKRDKDGNRFVTDAQRVAVKRALSGLRRQGLVAGWQDRIHTTPQSGHRHIEQCWYWRSADATPSEVEISFIADQKEQPRAAPRMRHPAPVGGSGLQEKRTSESARPQDEAF